MVYTRFVPGRLSECCEKHPRSERRPNNRCVPTRERDEPCGSFVARTRLRPCARDRSFGLSQQVFHQGSNVVPGVLHEALEAFKAIPMIDIVTVYRPRNSDRSHQSSCEVVRSRPQSVKVRQLAPSCHDPFQLVESLRHRRLGQDPGLFATAVHALRMKVLFHEPSKQASPQFRVLVSNDGVGRHVVGVKEQR